jgi:NTE family protein
VALDTAALETDLELLSGLDRYETVTWRIVRNDAGDHGLLVRARPKPYAPPFMMLGLNLENTTSSDFRITMTARYLSFDVLGSGSELRVDGTLGSNPGAGLELYQPLGPTPLFVAPYAGVGTATFNLIRDDAVVARYGQTFLRAGANVGVNLGAYSDLRLGAYIGHLDAGIEVGDPGLPEIEGKETVAELAWRYDGQDSTVVPSSGTNAETRFSYVFDGPDLSLPVDTVRSSVELSQLSGTASHFWSRSERGRLFLYGGLGTSFDNSPLPTHQFQLGSPLRLGSYDAGELRGDHYVIATGGYLHQLGRLPDFMGGPVYAGGWFENGDAFNDWDLATWRTSISLGVIMDTLVGPVLLAGSTDVDGRWRTYIGVGRIFR